MVTSILFVCTVNRFRSVVAEYFFRKMLEERNRRLSKKIEVSSAGIKTEEAKQMAEEYDWGAWPTIEGVPDEVVAFMQKRGMDLSRHQPRELNSGMLEGAGLVITMEDYHKKEILNLDPSTEGKVFTLREFVKNCRYFHAEGPICQFSLEYIDTVINQIEACLSEGMNRFLYYLDEEIQRPNCRQEE